MIDREMNPDFLNSFLDYNITILNKSPNSIKEYNYDLMNFLKYIKIHFKLTNEKSVVSIPKLVLLKVLAKLKPFGITYNLFNVKLRITYETNLLNFVHTVCSCKLIQPLLKTVQLDNRLIVFGNLITSHQSVNACDTVKNSLIKIFVHNYLI